MKSFDEWARELADGIGKREEPPIRAIEDEPNIWDVLPTDVEPQEDTTPDLGEMWLTNDMLAPVGQVIGLSSIEHATAEYEGVEIETKDFALARALLDAYWEANKTFSEKMEIAPSRNWAVSSEFTRPSTPKQKVQVTVRFDGWPEA